MKILTLQFKNLNSLKGEWKIDFTQSPFAENGLFAITGPTGAGKTTLLDAICLALYHQTPRLGQITASSNEIMTRGTAECSAEVEFEVKGASFRAHWSMRRSRGKPDGKLQAADVELAEVATGKVLATQVRPKNDEVERITGLDFGRFTKSMMLSQGQFAAFLNAKEAERAELLEELTGTEIYGQISERVHQLFAESKQQLATLEGEAKGVHLLTAEELKTLETGLAEITEKQTLLSTDIEAKQAHVNWWREHEKVAEATQQAQSAHAKSQADYDQARADLRRLAHSDPAETMRTPYNLLKEMRQQAKQNAQRVEEQSQNLSSLNGDLTKAKTDFERSDLALTQAKNAHQQQETLINEQVIPLDQQLNAAREKAELAANNLAEIVQKLAGFDHQAKDLARQKSTVEQALTTLAEYEKAHQPDQSLTQYLGQWTFRAAHIDKTVDGLRAVKQQGEQQRKAQTEQQVALDLALTHAQQADEKAQQTQTLWQKEQEHCLQLEQTHGSLAALETEQTRQQNIHRILLELKNDSQRWQELNTEYQDKQAKAEQNHAQREQQTKDVAAMRDAYSTQKKLIKALSALVEQDEQLAHYRHELKAGEACPLCGSQEHPKLAQSESSSAANVANLAEARSELDMLAEKGKAASEALNQTEYVLGELDKRLQQVTQNKAQIEAHWQRLCEQLQTLDIPNVESKVLLISDPVALGIFEQTHQQVQAQTQTAITAFKQAQTNRDAAKQQWDTEARLAEKLSSDCVLSKQQLDSLLQALSKTEVEYKDLHKQLGELEKDFADELSAQGFTPPEPAARGAWLEQKQADSEEWQTQQTLKEQHSQSLQTLDTQQQLNQQQQASSVSEQQNQQATQREAAETLASLQAKRLDIFGERLVSEARETSQQHLAQAEALYRKTQTVHQDLSENSKAVAASLSTLETQQSELLLLKKTRERAWSQDLSASPFVDETLFLAALLSDEERQALANKKQQLDNALARSQALLESANTAQMTLLSEPKAEVYQTLVKADVEDALADLLVQKDELAKREGEISQSIKADETRRKDQQTLFKKLEAYREEADDIKYLHALIGSQKGDKFRKFAQGLTLDNLVHLANGQLQRLHARYQLKRKQGEGLELSVLDTWQGDIERDTKTLSGGESFLVSLALALALSDLVSHKTSIDSLFMDEGFGTLDRETLDVALDALDNLNASGKMIGVISHIDAMKERIPVQLKVTKKSGLGVSELESVYRIVNA